MFIYTMQDVVGVVVLGLVVILFAAIKLSDWLDKRKK